MKQIFNSSFDSEDIKILIILALTQILCHFTAESISIALPAIETSLNLSPIYGNWLSLAYYTFCVGTGLIVGRILPQYGVVKSTKWGTIIIFIGVLLTVITISPEILIVGRALQGLAAAIFFVNSYIFIVRQYDYKKMGFILGLVSASSFIGSLIAPSIGGIILSYFDWHTLFLIILPFIIFQYIILVLIKKEWVYPKEKIDYIGSILSFIALFLFVLGTSYISSIYGMLSIFLSVILIIIFIKHETMIKTEPIYNVHLLRNIKHFTGNYLSMTSCLVRSGIIFILGIFFQNVSKLNPFIAGMIISIMPLTMLIISPIAGKLSDKYDSFKICEISLIMMIISLFMLILIIYIYPLYTILAMIILSLGCSFLDSPSKKITIETAPCNMITNSSSFLSTIRDFGMLLGVSLFTLIMSLTNMSPKLPSSWIFCTQCTTIILTFITLLGLILTFYSNETIKERFEMKYFKKLLKIGD